MVCPSKRRQLRLAISESHRDSANGSNKTVVSKIVQTAKMRNLKCDHVISRTSKRNGMDQMEQSNKTFSLFEWVVLTACKLGEARAKV